MAGNKGQKGIDKGLGFGGRLVHLPIGGNQGFTRHDFKSPPVNSRRWN
jgi:hypothetical protein